MKKTSERYEERFPNSFSNKYELDVHNESGRISKLMVSFNNATIQDLIRFLQEVEADRKKR
jgi:hypothetical protein